MARERGWSALLAEPWPRGEPFPAYSEFMPAPLPVVKPSGATVGEARVDGDEHGWRITAREATHELEPGLDALAAALAPRLLGLVDGDAHTRGLSRDLIDRNPYLPDVALPAGPLVAVIGLALSRTQDDKGRVRWTLLGSSDLGPGPAFWAGFRAGPTSDDDDVTAAARLAALLAPIGITGARSVAALHRAGVRIVPAGADPLFADEVIPPALTRLVVDDAHAAAPAVRAVITFRPWARLPASLRRAARAGTIALVPSPVSLAFAGHRGYRALAAALPGAMQLPLLRAVPMTLRGLRVPQSGWIDQGGHAGPVTHGAHRERVKRTHRWQRVHRDADDTAAVDYDDRVADALFATTPTALGLYDKPLAKNAHVWTHDYRLVLDGPRADRAALATAARTVASGGHFGYRFHWLPMRVGAREVVWHRPLAFAIAAPDAAPTRLATSDGVLHARRDDDADPIALWPRADDRAPWLALERGFAGDAEARHDVRKLLDARARLGAPLPRSLATRLVSADRTATWATWRAALAARATDDTAARVVTAAIDRTLVTRDPSPPPALTFAHTATRDYEQRYWRTIAGLAHATWRAKNNADGVAPSGPGRDLDDLADELARRHAAAIARRGLTGRAAVAHHWFRWTTDFDLPWSHGWARNQLHGPSERNVLCMIPGRDRSRAFVLADHYDTAYMEDVYDGAVRGTIAGTRHAAAGADDNHSATAALLLAAEVFLAMAAAGQLAHDVWLVHLTGEEFPGDSLGARHLARALVDRTLVVHEAGTDRPIELRHVTIAGAIVMDMIAHRDARAGDRFQIAPGDGAAAMTIAAAVHRATLAWNHGAARWNRTPARAAARPYRRRARGTQVPALAPHPTLVGELRPHWHGSSTVFNTDAQCWSDLGLPIVLLMEHYDIDRRGYHDTLDTLANIDLDFGAAVSAIAIEAVASLAAGAAPRSRARR